MSIVFPPPKLPSWHVISSELCCRTLLSTVNIQTLVYIVFSCFSSHGYVGSFTNFHPEKQLLSNRDYKSKYQNKQEEFVTETNFFFFRIWQVTAVGTKSCSWCKEIKNWCSWQRKTSQLRGAERKGPHEKLRMIWNAAWSEMWPRVRESEQEEKVIRKSVKVCVCQCYFICWHRRPWV